MREIASERHLVAALLAALVEGDGDGGAPAQRCDSLAEFVLVAPAVSFVRAQSCAAASVFVKPDALYSARQRCALALWVFSRCLVTDVEALCFVFLSLLSGAFSCCSAR